MYQSGKLIVTSVVLWIQFVGLYMVLVGLIGVKKEYLEVTPIPRRLNVFHHQPNVEPSGVPVSVLGNYRRSVEKIALIVIDAMRVDFITDENMPFLSISLDQSLGCFFKANVKSPTVTLPRIKAIVSGDISTYWDIVQNFNSKQISQDNFIWHAIQDANKKIVFYGDETWLTLFPKEFTRAEGTSSFFVTDFYEVDNNVTRNLAKELSTEGNWDMLILHYLGLDHIGHVHGPKSTLVPGKLREMDAVVQDVYNYLANLGGRSIIIVCGDHGMANVGGHGGNSYHETTTPVVVLSTESIPTCNQNNWRNLDHVHSIEQIDLAPTVSAFWGMTFPAASAGKVLWPLIDHLPLSERLFLAYYNSIQLGKFTDAFSLEFLDITASYSLFLTNDTHDNGEGEAILKRYHNLVMKLSHIAGDQLGQQNILDMASGIMLCIHSTLILFNWNSSIAGFTEIIIIIAVTGLSYTKQLSSVLQLLLQAVILLGFAVNIAIRARSRNALAISHSEGLTFLFAHHLLPFFYFSSSFIEEEHYLCYYFWTTGIVSLIFIPKKPTRAYESKSLDPGVSTERGIPTSCRILLLLLIHRIASAWNQTGQKWSHLDDIVDFLRTSCMLRAVVILSLIILCVTRRKKLNWLYLTIIVLVTCVKTDTRIPPIIENYLPNIVHLIFYLSILYLILDATRSNKRKPQIIFTNIFILLTLVLQKEENIPLVVLVLLQSQIFVDFFREFIPEPEAQATKWSHSVRSILVVLFSNAAFFYQANSNSITTIDVNAGYIGLTYYNEMLVGFLIFCNTFSFPTIVILADIESTIDSGRSSAGDSSPLFLYLAKSNAVGASIYSVVIFILRHHLFIWSVFAPKLMYVMAFTFYRALITLIYTLICEIKP